MLKTKKSYLVLLIAFALSACNGESETSTPVDPTDPTDPTDPIDPTDPTDPGLPVDPESKIVNIGKPLDLTLPSNPLNPLNPIVNKGVIPLIQSAESVYETYSDDEDGIMLYSKYDFDKSDSFLEVYTSGTYLTAEYDVYNIDEHLTPDYFHSANEAVKESIRNRVQPYFPLFSSYTNFLYNQHGGSNAVNCMVAIDYDNHINNSTPLEILTPSEVENITTLQATKSNPAKISAQIINQVMRVSALDDVRKNEITQNAIFKNSIYPDHYNDSENNENLEYICKGNSVDYNQFMKSISKISDSKIKTLEIEISRAGGVTTGYQNRLKLTGMVMTDSEQNQITNDIVDNVVIKNMILNKVFNWNGDGYSYLSKHSFINGKFTGLYEGIALHFAKQNFTSREQLSNCNPADITNQCTYPQVYGDYGLMTSYILSSDDTVVQIEKEAKLISFIDSLKNYNALGCGIEWADVRYDQVEMSNLCIEKAFDQQEFTKIDGSALTWSDLVTQWSDMKTNYIDNPEFVSGNSLREVLTFD